MPARVREMRADGEIRGDVRVFRLEARLVHHRFRVFVVEIVIIRRRGVAAQSSDVLPSLPGEVCSNEEAFALITHGSIRGLF